MTTSTLRARSAAAIIAGAAATVPFSFEQPWTALLVPLALALLFALADGLRPRQAAALGWLFGFAFFGTGVYWVYISTHVYGGAPAWASVVMGVLLFAYLAVYPAIALGVAVRQGWLRGAAGWIALPALWVLCELVRGWFYSGFPWLTLGYASTGTGLVRLAPLVGVTGISAVLVLGALALFRLARSPRPARRVALAVLAGIAAVTLVLPAPGAWTHEDGEALDVAIVQGNIAQDQKWRADMQLPTLQRYYDLTRASLGADLVVWPEVALTQRLDEVRTPFLEPLARQVAARGGTMVTGIVIGEPERHGYYNSLVALGASEGRYDKRHLVPFGEYFPIPDFMRPLMLMLGTPYEDFLFGAPQQAPITVKGRRLGASICFEDAFGQEIRGLARDAALLVNATNDAWFARSPAARQHLQIARMRAVETGRVVVRAANTGISAVIGPDGEFLARSGWFTTEVLRSRVQPRSGMTPYVRMGDGPLWWASGLLVLLFSFPRLRGKAGMGASHRKRSPADVSAPPP